MRCRAAGRLARQSLAAERRDVIPYRGTSLKSNIGYSNTVAVMVIDSSCRLTKLLALMDNIEWPFRPSELAMRYTVPESRML